MPPVPHLAAAIALAVALSAPAHAGEFRPPAGWKGQAGDPNTYMMGGGEDGCILNVGDENRISVPAERWYESLLQSMQNHFAQQGHRVGGLQPTRTTTDPQGFATEMMVTMQGRDLPTVLLGIRSGGAVRHILYQCTSRALYEQHWPGVRQQVIASAR